MNFLKVYGLTCVLTMVAAFAGATTIVMPTDEQLIAKSPVIVEGTVVSSAPVVYNDAVWTDTVVEVARPIKGAASKRITVRELGGQTEDRITKIFGSPEFVAGERVLLFLENSPRGGYRTMDLFAGKMKEARAANGRRLWLRDDAKQDVNLLDANLQPIEETKNVQRDAAKFEKFVADRLAGRKGVKDYGVGNPVLDNVSKAETVEGDGANITAQFTLISEPTVYRWQKFDGGQSANWYHGGEQTGYSGGGVNELKTAMAAWTGYTQANIRYSYIGLRTGSLGGLSGPNGYNEVLFNDPNNEISGTFSGSGVVGQGGFNGVSGSSTWTAPFTADAEHTAGSKKQWHITEGNLVIQDGVTASRMSSNRLAEILSHEFGHTLGFGHSASSNALMYYSVTGLGPSLRADDQTAARWLYPNGSTEPAPETIPAAPSSLAASVSGDDVTLTWNDNSSNESGFRLYLALGTGSFSKVADNSANDRNVTLTNLAAGSWRAYVTSWNSAGTSANSNTAGFTIGSAPVAGFAVSPSSGTAGVTTFSFYDESTGTVSSRTWSFGDGGTSGASVASHVYSTAGTYTVTLTVSGNGTTSQTSKTVSVSAAATKPVAAFSLSPSSGTAGQTSFTFYDNSTGTISSRTWNFGDGATSTASVASHVYASAGTYTVTLTVSGSAGSSQTSKSVSVSAPAPVTQPVSASFDYSGGTAGSPLSFFDRSSGSPTSWAWTFGDGSSSSQRNPTHTYSTAGTYTVRLTASNASSSSSYTRSVTVTAPSAEPYRTLVSAAAQTDGAGGTSWRTELTLFNAGAQGASVTILFLPNGGGNVATRTLVLSPKQAATYGNALVDLFGIWNAAGALAIEATSSGSAADLRVTSRTFTSGIYGTYGQSVPDVAPEQLEQTLYVTGIEAGPAYRTNIGIVNRASTGVSTTLSLYSSTGSALSTKNVWVNGNSFQQSALGSYFPEVAAGVSGALTMRITATSADSVSAYASVIDNVTQDPVYVQAVPARSGASLTLPVVSRASGANGTYWRSDVTLFNPTSSGQSFTLRFGAATKSVYVGSRDTKVLADVLTQFGLSAGTGPLEISWSGGDGPVVTSRTYTTAGAGTYGQSIDPVAAFTRQMFVPGLRNDASYRTNVGFVNGGGESETFSVRALSSFGTEIGRATLTLTPGQLLQAAAGNLFPGASLGSFTLVVEGDGNARLFAYGSMVDNATGDPVFYAGR